MTLDPVQVRVLGALIEKEIVTPENYPLSLNSLQSACNQKSSRDPVLELGEEQVRQALHGLEEMGLTAAVRDSRVAKYEHRIRTVLNLRRDETALLCLLFLRGPQTPGELRSRADRMYSFDGLEPVESALARLMAPSEGAGNGRDDRPLVAVLPRHPGSREARYAHLLGGPVEVGPRQASRSAAGGDEMELGFDRAPTVRLAELEAEVKALRLAVAAIEAKLDMRADG